VKEIIGINKKNMIDEDSWKIHPSFRKNLNFQRLEFFGDKLIAFEVSKILLLDKSLNEGDLSIVLSSLVCRDTMAKIGTFLIPDIKYSGKLTINMIASVLEAWIGYEYIKGTNVTKLIYDLWSPYLFVTFHSNVKNIVQEYSQKNNQELVYKYELIDNESSNNKFKCHASIGNISIVTYGQSKKKSSENAAKLICEKLKLL